MAKIITSFPSIECLISGCVKNKRQAQTQLYNMLKKKMFVLCLRYSNGREEAEEILQEGFIKVFQFIHQFKNNGSFEGWVRKIMVNCALQKCRIKKLHAVTNIEACNISNPPAENINSQLGAKELLQIVQQLPPSYKVVFNLHVFEGMKHREIAELLKISEGTSKSNLSAARNFLQKRLASNSNVFRLRYS